MIARDSIRLSSFFAVLLAAASLVGCAESLKLGTGIGRDGFYVSGTKLYDAEGAEFRIQGANANHWWNTGSDNRASVPYIKAAGANAARLVFGPVEEPDHPDWYVCKTTAERRAVVEEYIKYRIVPIVEYHNATGSNDPAKVDEAADFWIGEKEWIGDEARYVIINLTNEWCASNATDEGGRRGSDELWRDTYLAAVAKLRAAGIVNTLIIDSINWASTISAVEKYGKALIDADPRHNILFSLHMYAGWRAPGDPEDDDSFYMNVDAGLDRLAALGLPVIIGEFNHDCSISGEWGDPEAAENAELLAAFDARGTGWLCWMWFNSSGNRENMVLDSDSLLYTDFGKTIAAHLKSAKEASSFPSDPLPPLPGE